MYSNLFINVKKNNHDLSSREKAMLNLLFTQAIISVNDQITQISFGVHEQEKLEEDLLHHNLTFTSEINDDMLESLKEAINGAVISILHTLNIQNYNIQYYNSN